jgi:hypothetical protein
MHVESAKFDVVGKRLNYVFDVEVILGLPCSLLMLEFVHALIKVAQGKYVFVCDFVEVVKMAKQKLYKLYCDPYAKFEDLTFDDFNVIQTLNNSNFPLEWFSNLNGGEDYLAFSFASHKYHVYYKSDEGAKGPKPVTKFAFSHAVNKVKEECEGSICCCLFYCSQYK